MRGRIRAPGGSSSPPDHPVSWRRGRIDSGHSEDARSAGPPPRRVLVARGA